MIDQKIIEGFQKEDSKSIIAFEKKYKNYIFNITRRFGIKDKDFLNDIYSDTIIFLLKKCQQNFVLTSKLSTYIYPFVRNKAIKYRIHEQRHSDIIEYQDKGVEYEFQEMDIKKRLVHLIIEKFCSDSNKKLLKLTLEGKTQEEISVIMGYKNNEVVKSKKYEIIKLIRSKLEIYKNMYKHEF